MSFSTYRVEQLKRERLSFSVARILSIIAFIEDNPVCTADEIERGLRKRFEFCRRTLYRDLRLLADLGTIEAVSGFGYSRGRSSWTFETTGRINLAMIEKGGRN